MTIRAQAFAIALVALAILAAASWFLRGSERSSPRAEASVIEEVAERDAPILEPVERAASEPVTGSLREAIEAPAAEERGTEADVLPATPERPGPGQALLVVEVVAAETGAPLAGVELCLWTDTDSDDPEYDYAESRQTVPFRGLEGDDVVTGEAGKAEFVVFANRAYGLSGYAPGGLADTRRLELEPTFEPLDEGEERVERVILPTAWTLVWQILVVDGETEQPIVGAEVEVLDGESEEPLEALPVIARATTDGRGRAPLRLPAWKSMEARIEAVGYFWDGCSVFEESQSTEIDALVQLHRPAALTAVVLDASGEPAVGIDVGLRPSGTRFFTPMRVDWTATTDASGMCEFRELPARVQLQVELRHAERVLWRPKAPQTGVVWLEPGEHLRIDWRLEPGCVLSCRVHDQDGNPLARFPLALLEVPDPSLVAEEHRAGVLRNCRPYDSSERMRLARATTDDVGRFSFPEVRPGIVGLVPDTQGPREIEERRTSTPSDEFPEVVRMFSIAPDEPAKHVEVVFDRGLYLSGKVLDPEGSPLPGVNLHASAVPAGYSPLVSRSSSDGEGRFVLGPLAAGRYSVRASPGDAYFVSLEPVEAAAGEDGVILQLSWGGTLRGRVVDEAGGEPLNAGLFLAGPLERRSNADGDGFRIENLPPGTYDLTALAHDGRVGVLRGIVLGPGRSIEELVVPVAHGARILTRTEAPRGSLDRIRIEWEGILVWSWWGGEPRMNVFVPPGAIRVSWWALENGVERLVHEERRSVAAGEEASFEYVVPE